MFRCVTVPAQAEGQGQQRRDAGRFHGHGGQRGAVPRRQGRRRGMDPPGLRQGIVSRV